MDAMYRVKTRIKSSCNNGSIPITDMYGISTGHAIKCLIGAAPRGGSCAFLPVLACAVVADNGEVAAPFSSMGVLSIAKHPYCAVLRTPIEIKQRDPVM